MEEALQYILDTARGSEPEQLCFVNTDCINQAQSNADYSRCLREAAIVLADGIGIRVAGKILRQPIRQNVNGTDMFPILNARLEGSDLGLFFLGARPGIAEKVAEWTQQNFPHTRVKGIHHGFFSPEEEPEVLKKINDSGAEILLVAFGAPRQDLWIAQNLPKLRVGLAMGVGGLFDFYSGQIPRAPQWLRELSLEWTYRLYQEPGRMWQRYLLGNLVFLYRVLLSAVACRSKQARAAGLRGQ
jgi:N-acetylglucosaminyldiphosphoundecaprenol N-acetyl-beta-D-mannosaminyltransferase